jgi:hypothetical protein
MVRYNIQMLDLKGYRMQYATSLSNSYNNEHVEQWKTLDQNEHCAQNIGSFQMIQLITCSNSDLRRCLISYLTVPDLTLVVQQFLRCEYGSPTQLWLTARFSPLASVS